MSGPVLTTARLILRPPVADDLDGFAELMADDATARFVGGVQPRLGAWRSLAAIAGSWSLHGFGMFSVLDRAPGGPGGPEGKSGRWIGRIGPWRPPGWPGDEIGWAILPAFAGRGLATEGALATMDWARDALGWREVVHVIHPDNAPSRALAARLGSRRLRIGHLPPPHSGDPREIWGQTLAP